MKGNRVLIAMSGGVDSSTAAIFLRRDGYECIGATMLLASDSSDGAASAAEALDMPFHVLDVREEFRREVMASFAAAYLAGETPNPCVICNRTMKFGQFISFADSLGADKVATGHYARVERCGNRFLLKKGADAAKDQSYVLYSLSQAVLSRLLLPLGIMTKSEVRAEADMASLPSATLKESQDICFVPDGDFAAFIERFTGRKSPEGSFVSPDGEVIGRHRGLIRYTIGQHKHLGLGLHNTLYVLEKNAARNEIVLGTETELYKRTVALRDVNWIACDATDGVLRGAAKLRYRHSEQPAALERTGENEYTLTFDEPQRAPAPGQAAVLYDGDTVVCGGTII